MDTQKYKIKLEEEKKDLLEELGGIGKEDDKGDWNAAPESEDNAQEVQDEADIAERAEDFEIRSSTLIPLEKRLGMINKALAKIEEGTYGICETCGKEIEEERLAANPAAFTCKDCMDIID